MGLKEKISVLFWLVIGVSVTLASIKLGIGRVSNPGPGFMSFFAGLLVIFLSLLLAGSEIRKRGYKLPSHFTPSTNVNFIIALCSLFGFVLVFNTLGYLISIGLFVFILFKTTAPKKWLSPLYWSIGVSLATYFLFSFLLKCTFPKGIFNLG